MKAVDVLKAMSESETLADEVIGYLNHGMTDEWDCTLSQGLELGFGGTELRLAARTGLALAEHHEANG